MPKFNRLKTYIYIVSQIYSSLEHQAGMVFVKIIAGNIGHLHDILH